MSSSKPAFMMLFALVILLVLVASQTEAVNMPIWCFCSDWDGGSCGFEIEGAYKLFLGTCQNIRGKSNCWN
ncbi:hypothetical protein BGZ95_009274 [Linnemannia exigua]|uniref:Uncharacterized protein n=1 Tax=Linnemannia exigua TaxID=604196 RepID=A0AAD4DD92_9FUNG|nr:hypothetical protein BGZ95_009274 [Linnemannia exigua]